MDSLPQDINMLFSFVNMKLRDEYDSLDAFCEDLNVDKEELIKKLSEGGFEYNESQKKILVIFHPTKPFLLYICNVLQQNKKY